MYRICKTGLPSDIVVEVGEISFHLHKFPLLSRSAVLENLIENFHSEEESMCTLELYDIPGGAKSFELVAKFCYGVKIELTSSNIVALRCAAEHLRMTEEYGEANLIAQTEVFLNEVFCSWKDSIKALETCEEVLPHAEELHIVSRCINSLAMKACADPALFGWPVTTGKGSSRSTPNKSGVLWNGIGATGKGKNVNEGWWYEDVSVLNLSLYKRLILAVELSGMAPENIAGSLIYYGKGRLPGLSRRSSFREGTSRAPPSSSSAPESNENEHKTLLEEIVELMPLKKGVTSTRHLLGLLRSAILLHASSQCRESLEKRIGAQLDEAALEDLLIPNLGFSVETLYDTDCVQRILDYFMSADQTANANSPSILDEGQLIGSPSLTPMTMVAKLVDGYLAEVAPDANLKLPKFQSLATLIPDFARPLDDGIYRAIDIYLKAHPWLTDSEKEQLCRLMNCQKLSMEACTHAAQNERLPLRVVVQVLFFEQLRLRTSIAGWFFVSDSHDNPRGNLGLSGNDISEQAGLALDSKEDPLTGGMMEDMKVRVKELEKECMDMRQEIEKLCKPKNSWSLFSKLGIGGKKKYSWIEKEEPANEKE